MDNTKVLLGLAARRLFTLIGAYLASKGLLQGTDATSFVGACMVLAEVGYEGWNRYGKVLVDAQLARMKGVHPSSPSSPPNLKVVAAFLIGGFALSFGFPAHAASVSSALTPQSVAQKIQQLAAPDVAYAIVLAKAVNTPQGNVRAQCYQAIQSAIPTPPAGSTPPPAPHLVTNVEQLAEVIDALQPNGPLMVNCGGAAQLVGQNVLTFINAVVTGFLGAAKALPLVGL